MPFSRPTLTTLVARAQDDFDARLPGADSRLRRSFLNVFSRVHAGALNGVYGLLDFMWRQIFPDTAEAEQLARWASIWGVARKGATLATGTATLTGTNGAIIPIGTGLIRRDGVEYVTSEAVLIAAGTASVRVDAVIAGPSGDALEGQSLQFVSPVAGVNAVALVAAGGLVGGLAEEDDELLRARLLDRIQQPPHGGNAHDYVTWALEVPGVTRAWVYPGELGIGTVSVRFVMDERSDIIPTPDDVDLVFDHIDALRPAGMKQLYVVAPIPVPLDFAIKASPPTALVEAAITEELRDLVRREAEPGGSLKISHIDEVISLAAGEIDHEVITPSGNVMSPTGHISVFGSIAFIG